MNTVLHGFWAYWILEEGPSELDPLDSVFDPTHQAGQDIDDVYIWLRRLRQKVIS